MKNIILKYLLAELLPVLLVVPLAAQSTVPVKLALLTESAEAQPAADLLTASFSTNSQIQLLERDQIEKVYHEQALSAGNTDYLKLGRLLGADGLLLLEVVVTPRATNLSTRLIAVKPGVILNSQAYDWPLKDLAQWAGFATKQAAGFLPKLTVLPKEAIPLSVVNLRSAITSAEGAEMERELKLLAIQRLSAERQLFVTEREKLSAAAEEKSLATDESAFWAGSYLLEGTVDQNGYSRETVTINARLTPSKGGPPVLLDVSGSRTNLAAVVNALALKLVAALSVQPTATEWNPADEAAQYFAEAQWAFAWGALAEAEMAVDSAWALGKRDLPCAMLRIRAYTRDLRTHLGHIQKSDYAVSPRLDDARYPNGRPPSEREVQEEIAWISSSTPSGAKPLGLIYKVTAKGNRKDIDYAYMDTVPETGNIDRARHVLALYEDFSRNAPDALPKPTTSESGGSSWHKLEWYGLGKDILTAAAEVLQEFQLVHAAQRTTADRLAVLRAQARSVAELLDSWPPVHDSYFTGNRMVTRENMTLEDSDIFSLELQWGCFWQETPEDCLALYRGLMSSPVFGCVHGGFWCRPVQTPRLVAWDDTTRQRIPAVWDGFVRELNESTNVMWRLEAKALAVADASSDQLAAVALTNLFAAMFENQEAFITNQVELLGYDDWQTGNLAQSAGDKMWQLYYSEYHPKLQAINGQHASYWKQLSQAAEMGVAFSRQTAFLKACQPFDIMGFFQIFELRDYSRSQALEILPLVTAYKSNLLAQLPAASTWQAAKIHSAMVWIGDLEKDINKILQPAVTAVAPVNTIPRPAPPPPARPTVSAAPASPSAEVVSNLIPVTKFLAIPLAGLPGEGDLDVRIAAHHWMEEKLLLDIRYSYYSNWFDGNGNFQGGAGYTRTASALLNPVTEHWQVVAGQLLDITKQNYFYHHSVLLHGALFTCENGEIQKYDFGRQQWQVLEVSNGGNYALFAINDHLYATDGGMILELAEDGKSSHILASTRRRPPVTLLDTQNLGIPTLFAGPNHSLWVGIQAKILAWTGQDWRVSATFAPGACPPEVFAEGVLFRQTGSGPDSVDSLSRLSTGDGSVSLCFREKSRASRSFARMASDSRRLLYPATNSSPHWKLPDGLALPQTPVALHHADVYLLTSHSEFQDITDDQHVVVKEKVIAQNGYNNELWRYTDASPRPQRMCLKFADGEGCPPVLDNKTTFEANSLPPVWMLFASNFLVFGSDQSDYAGLARSGRIGLGYPAGVWLLPMAQIEATLAADASATQSARGVQLAKYDRNHNGILDPDEKEAALADPAFIALELDAIDANHNGLLDPDELAYFDANGNKRLDTNEQTGINLTRELLVRRLMGIYDQNGDGVLDRGEFEALLDDGFGALADAFPGLSNRPSFPSRSRNQVDHIGPAELDDAMKATLQKKLRVSGQDGPRISQFVDASDPATPVRIDRAQYFKALVEFYWQHHE